MNIRTCPLALLVVIYILFLWLLPTLFGPSVAGWIMEENGPMEGLSVALWLLAAAYLLIQAPPVRLVSVTFAIVFVALAIRETGLPPELVRSGRMLVKLTYYLHSADPVHVRVITGIIVLSILGSLIHACISTLRYLFGTRGYWQQDGKLLLLAFATLVVSQVVEQSFHFLEIQFGSLTGWEWALSFLALEEGLECLAAFFVLVAVICSITAARRGNPIHLFPARPEHETRSRSTVYDKDL